MQAYDDDVDVNEQDNFPAYIDGIDDGVSLGPFAVTRKATVLEALVGARPAHHHWLMQACRRRHTAKHACTQQAPHHTCCRGSSSLTAPLVPIFVLTPPHTVGSPGCCTCRCHDAAEVQMQKP